jgi:hypothetical protein
MSIVLSMSVMSSCLCKKPEGAVFPFQVESLEDGVDDPIHALHVHKANHGSGAAPHFQRSMMLVVRNFFHKGRGKANNDSSSGRSRSSCQLSDSHPRQIAGRRTTIVL